MKKKTAWKKQLKKRQLANRRDETATNAIEKLMRGYGAQKTVYGCSLGTFI